MRVFKVYSDDKLVELMRQQDMAAFDEIYYRYWKRLYAMAYNRVHSKMVAEELVQEIFISVWVNRATLQVQNLSGYLFTAAKYKVISYYERQLTRKTYLEKQTAITQDRDDTTEQTVLLNDLHDALDREVNKLPARCREVFRLSREENLSIKQVAAQMGVSEKTVENQLLKALKVLRISLRHYTMSVIVFFFLP
jgi:RNA polymerase sigma-70 factor (ECF subfamily)